MFLNWIFLLSNDTTRFQIRRRTQRSFQFRPLAGACPSATAARTAASWPQFRSRNRDPGRRPSSRFRLSKSRERITEKFPTSETRNETWVRKKPVRWRLMRILSSMKLSAGLVVEHKSHNWAIAGSSSTGCRVFFFSVSLPYVTKSLTEV